MFCVGRACGLKRRQDFAATHSELVTMSLWHFRNQSVSTQHPQLAGDPRRLSPDFFRGSVRCGKQERSQITIPEAVDPYGAKNKTMKDTKITGLNWQFAGSISALNGPNDWPGRGIAGQERFRNRLESVVRAAAINRPDCPNNECWRFIRLPCGGNTSACRRAVHRRQFGLRFDRRCRPARSAD